MNVQTFTESVSSLSNEQINQMLDKFPLLAEGFDALECPCCGVVCFPQIKYKNNTIRYNKHLCKDRILTWMEEYKSFSILEDGSLKEK